MKFLKLIIKLAVAFIAFGAFASLYLSKNKNDYITLEHNDLNLY